MKSRGGLVLGLLFLFLGVGVVTGILLRSTITTAPLALGIAVAVLGALMVNPTAVKTGVADLGETVGPYIRLGRRENDPLVPVADLTSSGPNVG